MCDFLIGFDPIYRESCLLDILAKPYEGAAPKGRFFDFPWGSMAVLEEHLADNRNIIVRGDVIVAWVGDLVLDVSDQFIARLVDRIQGLMGTNTGDADLQSDEVFQQLNGTFALVVADSSGVAVVTDMLGFTQVYVGEDAQGSVVCLGTHPDLVSAICGTWRLDTVSVGEFLSQGTPRFPHTMYENVKELEPGTVHIFRTNGPKRQTRRFVYWYPPEEIRGPYDVGRLGKELKERLVAAIRDRCTGDRVGVTLSGGLDSRLILAAVPQEIDCVGITFCDYPNRETHIAERVARCYGRQWVPIVREKEFLARSLVRIVKLEGCEFEFFGAHAVGIAEDISRLGFNSILGGMQMDVYLKAYFAADWLRRKRMKGLLADKYERIRCDYIKGPSAFESQIVAEEVVSQILLRRRQNYSERVDCSRGSISEWLIMYPFSQDKIGACWAAERRILPVKLVATDRRLLDFAFRCPVELKLGNRIFMEAALSIYGCGAHIPNAEDGVRPGSGHWSRLFQRAMRKLQSRTVRILEKLGKEPQVQGSWHDYQKYWRESEKLRELIREYGANLDQFDGILFKDSGPALLENRDLDWRYGFRLLQLAVWLGIIEEYRNMLKGRP